MSGLDEQTVERVAWAMWREETRESGTPSGVTNGRTPDAFSEQSPELRAKWHKFARAAIASMPDTTALKADMLRHQIGESERRRENQKKTIIHQREENAILRTEKHADAGAIAAARNDALRDAIDEVHQECWTDGPMSETLMAEQETTTLAIRAIQSLIDKETPHDISNQPTRDISDAPIQQKPHESQAEGKAHD